MGLTQYCSARHLLVGLLDDAKRKRNYRRVATRYEKTDANYFSFLCLASLLTSVM